MNGKLEDVSELGNNREPMKILINIKKNCKGFLTHIKFVLGDP